MLRMYITNHLFVIFIAYYDVNHFLSLLIKRWIKAVMFHCVHIVTYKSEGVDGCQTIDSF